MKIPELSSLKLSTTRLEDSLQAMENYLEKTNNPSLYLATGSLVEALKHLYAVEPKFLNPTNQLRIEELLLKEKKKSGRDSFNTGF